MPLMTHKEIDIFAPIAIALVLISLLVGLFADNETKPYDNAVKLKNTVESSFIATGIYVEALARKDDYDAWELVQKNALDHDIRLFCSIDSKYGDCLKFWVKLADDRFIVESLRVISRGEITIVFSGDNSQKLFEVADGGLVYIPMSATVEDIKQHLRSKG